MGRAILILLVITYMVGAPIWAYHDAQKNCLDAKFCLVLCLFGGILLYLYYRHRNRNQRL